MTAAYLHSMLDQNVWVKQSPGFSLAAPGKVLKCIKALYGTKQASKCWWKFIAEKLSALVFVPSQFYNSFSVLQKGKDVCIVWIHMEDGEFTGSNSVLLADI